MDLSETARLGLAYTMSLVSWWANTRPRPFSASFAVTNRCNLRCSYCNTPFLDPSHLSLEEIEVILRRLRRLGVQRLGLLGGEPLVRKDLSEIIDVAKRIGFYVSVNSNLNLYDRRPEVFDRVDLVMTSLDGNPETHRKNRGERAYDGVVEAIRDLLERDKPVVAIAVITEHNLDQVEYLLSQAEEVGFQLHLQPQCTETAIVRGSIPGSLTDERLRAFWAGLLEKKRAGRPIASSAHYLEVQSRWSNFRVSSYQDPKARCAAGWGYLYVDPQGKAYPCAYTKEKMNAVDLLEQDWRTGFSGKTPCTQCNVGPMLEFNLLFQKPLSASRSALSVLA